MTMFDENQIIQAIGETLGNADHLADDAYFDPITRQVYNTDMLVEGVHFSMDYFAPDTLAQKALAVNLSDINAMGAIPEYALISLGLPSGVTKEWVDAFYTGIKNFSESYQIKIIGGDTVKSPQFVVNIAMTGNIDKNTPLISRKSAKAGDIILSTGYHGLSHVGLYALQNNSEHLFPTGVSAHLSPDIPVEAIKVLKEISENSIGGMDSSDGLADAAIKLSQASQCSIELDVSKFPVHPDVQTYCEQSGSVLSDALLYGGEDFQLVITLPEKQLTPDILNYFTPIGNVLGANDTNVNPSASLRHFDGTLEKLDPQKTFQHF